MPSENDINIVTDKIRTRARKTRIFALVGVVFIVFVVIFIISFFLYGFQREWGLPKDSTPGTYEMIAMLDVIASSILRIGSVFLAIFLVQILVNLTKYNFRIADHLDITADAVELCLLDDHFLKTASTLMSLQHIDFTKGPAPPTDQAMKVIKEAISRIPNGK